jgi:selenide,water dikinase
VEQSLLTDPQTSGGLLVACAQEAVPQVLAIFAAHGFAEAAEIGGIEPANAGGPRLEVV